MNQKFAKLLVTLLALSLVLTGCGGAVTDPDTTADSTAASTEGEHVHQGQWSADLESHWFVCTDCGETVNLDAHDTDEYGYCAVCGKSVLDFGDGTYSVFSYDEQGVLCEDAYYDADGALLSRYRYVYEYYDDGNVKSEKDYIYDPACYGEEELLVSESVFLYCEDPENGEVYQSECTMYSEDGSKTWTQYSENWEILQVVEYDTEGNELSVSRYEYQRDENGDCTYMAVYIDEVLDFEEFYTNTEFETGLITKQLYYNTDGSVLMSSEYEYEFDDAGNLLRHTAYTDGLLDWEDIYETDGDGCTYLAKEIDYDENGEILSEICYDADGNEIE